MISLCRSLSLQGETPNAWSGSPTVISVRAPTPPGVLKVTVFFVNAQTKKADRSV